MSTLALLARVREAGARPASPMVTVWYGDEYSAPKVSWLDSGALNAEVHIKPAERVHLLDVRCLVGLPISVFAHTWTDQLGRLLERIKTINPPLLLVQLFDAARLNTDHDPEKFGGFVWTPERGTIAFSEWLA